MSQTENQPEFRITIEDAWSAVLMIVFLTVLGAGALWVAREPITIRSMTSNVIIAAFWLSLANHARTNRVLKAMQKMEDAQ